MVIQNRENKKHKYWDPMEAPGIRFKNDEEYDEAFREILTESTSCKLRSIGNTGILLSGGFDSCTVGCIAAGLLDPEGKKLKSYTSIPMDGYIERFGKNIISDESPYVEEIIKMYKNIEPTFCRSEGKNSFSDIEKYLDIVKETI
jgi:asparagine synthase (glutamine-hydrolysing)